MRRRESGTKNGMQSDLLGTYQNGSSISKIYAPPHPGNYHSCLDEVHKNYPNEGGPLSIVKYTTRFGDAHLKTGYMGYNSPGEVIDCDRRVYSASTLGILPDDYDATMDLGAEAWNRFRPKLSKVQLGQTIAEITDVPKLFQSGLRNFKDLGSRYLQYQFGWKPFIKDLTDSLKLYRKMDDHLAKMQKHNNKWLKRGGVLYQTENFAHDQHVIVTPMNYLTVTNQRRTTRTYEKAWFEGAFRYYIPGLTNGNWGKLRLARKLFGVELTPSLVYELVPWSWLADWFGNFGDVVSNYTSITTENMVAKYAYVMRHKHTTVTCSASITGRFTEWLKPPTYTTQYVQSEVSTETKTRAVANPFGFDAHLADFTSYQLSILGALGLSRQRFL